MRFKYEGKEYERASAIEILRDMERDIKLCSGQRLSVKEFVSRSLASLADRIHQRDLEPSDHLSEEMLALSYLCLLDEYGVGRLDFPTPGKEAEQQPVEN